MRAPGLGGRQLIRLAEESGGLDVLLTADSARLRALGVAAEAQEALRHPDPALLEADLEWLAVPDHHLLTWADEDYPALLRRIPSPPPALFVAGEPGALWQPQLAVIGSRNPTQGGLGHARAFTAELVRAGLAITSGLAEGVDAAAHRAALDAGGVTVAVAGTGLRHVYPRSSAGLARDLVAARGAIVSELPLDAPPRRAHFPSRNRIISGLSLGVLVIEAALRSGTLITARLAGEQGREVFALPGSLHNPLSKGCHRLIREGARLVQTAGDILEDLGPLAGELAGEIRRRLEAPPAAAAAELDSPHDDPKVGWDDDYALVWSHLGFDPTPVDRIVETTGLTVQSVSSMLLMLELRGKVEAHAGGAYSRTQPEAT